jgi:hypothetical protein
MMGYLVATVRNVQNGRYVLPEIDASIQWKDGAMLMLANIAVGLIVGTISFSITFATSLASTYESSSEIGIFTGMLAIFGSFVNLAINIVVAFVQMLMVVVYAKTGSLNELIVMENYQTILKNNGATVFIAMVLVYVVGSIVPMLGLLFCCIGIFPAAVIVSFITAGLYGQISTEGIASLVQQEVVKTAEG